MKMKKATSGRNALRSMESGTSGVLGAIQSRPEVEVQKPRGLWGFEREMSPQGLMRLDLCPLLVALFRGAMKSRGGSLAGGSTPFGTGYEVIITPLLTSLCFLCAREM